MKLNKIQIIVLTIGFFLPIFIEVSFYDYYIHNSKLQDYLGEGGYIFISIMMFYYIFISTLLVLFLLDNMSKKFNRLQKIGLLFGGLLVNFYLVSIIYLIGVYFYNISGIHFPTYCPKFQYHYFPFLNLFKYILKITGVSFCTWLWVFIFKNKKTNPLKP